MKCDSCGAEVPKGAEVCAYCGGAFETVTLRQTSRAETFAAIKSSPQFAAEQLSRTLSALPNLGLIHAGGAFGFFALFVGATVFIGTMMLTQIDGGPGPLKLMAVVPFGMAAIGAFAFAGMFRQFVRVRTAKPLASPAIVSSKRTRLSGGGGKSSATTSYFATFEFEDGRRQEFSVDASLFAELAENDPGIVFRRADWVAKFERIR